MRRSHLIAALVVYILSQKVTLVVKTEYVLL